MREYPDLVKQYFGTIIPANDNKFAALNSAVWSGGSFIYVPEGVQDRGAAAGLLPHQRREHGPVRADADHLRAGLATSTTSKAAPRRPISTDSLHSAVVEIIVQEGARCRYTTIQNWSKNVYNLVTKRAAAYKNATMEWVDGNLGSKLTMKYPAVWLMEPGARGEMLSVAFAGDGQHQDAGGKIVHVAPNTSSQIISKSISKGTGRSSYRGLVKVYKGAEDVKQQRRLRRAAARRNEPDRHLSRTSRSRKSAFRSATRRRSRRWRRSRSSTCMSRGLTEDEAMSMIVNGFIEPIAKELPLEYAVELNRLIQLEMEGSVG